MELNSNYNDNLSNLTKGPSLRGVWICGLIQSYLCLYVH